jgi:hypothetical protein
MYSVEIRFKLFVLKESLLEIKREHEEDRVRLDAFKRRLNALKEAPYHRKNCDCTYCEEQAIMNQGY